MCQDGPRRAPSCDVSIICTKNCSASSHQPCIPYVNIRTAMPGNVLKRFKPHLLFLALGTWIDFDVATTLERALNQWIYCTSISEKTQDEHLQKILSMPIERRTISSRTPLRTGVMTGASIPDFQRQKTLIRINVYELKPYKHQAASPYRGLMFQVCFQVPRAVLGPGVLWWRPITLLKWG